VVTVEGKKRSPEELERWIAVELANALRKSPNEIDPMKPATYYGLDSIVGMSITAELEEYVGRRLSQTVLWELPTIRELAKHLSGGGGGLAPGAVGAPGVPGGGLSIRIEGGAPSAASNVPAPPPPKSEDDHDPAMHYEYPSGGWNFIIGVVLLIFQGILPLRMAQRLLGASSLGGMEVLNNVTRYPALEVMYSYKGGLPPGNGLVLRLLEYIWQHLRNARALRNRLRMVKRELRRSISAALERKDKINCLSVGAGSARAWLEVLAEMPEHESARVTLTLLDRDPRALEFGAKRARDSGVKATLQFQEGRAEDMASRYPRGTFDVVEIVGVLDYLRQEEALGLCRLAWHVTAPLGEYITANIRNNPEVTFVKRVIGWPMIYRDPPELAQLADVMPDRINARLMYEPMLIHGVLIGRKRRET
jgi:acyl carrier protein